MKRETANKDESITEDESMKEEEKDNILYERKFFKSFDHDLNRRIEKVSFKKQLKIFKVHEKYCGFHRNRI